MAGSVDDRERGLPVDSPSEIPHSTSPQRFLGPLFIVGRPRSGTKLLRTLLNEHPQISIPVSETNLLPEMIGRFGEQPRLDEAERLDNFYEWFSGTFFFDRQRKLGNVLTKDDFTARGDLTSWPSILETIVKYYAPRPLEEGVVWGDKSPGYLPWIASLKEFYPEAKMLHILRDPRDVCLSTKKAWGRSLYRSADAWYCDVSTARRAGRHLGRDYMEIAFEALLSDPERTLEEVCRFLEIEYDPAMLAPSVSHEELGDAAGALHIVSDNRRKYVRELTPRVIKRIEEIVFPTMTESGYSADYAGGHRPLGFLMRRFLHAYDALAMTRHHSRVMGMRWGLKYLSRRATGRFLAARRAHP